MVRLAVRFAVAFILAVSAPGATASGVVALRTGEISRYDGASLYLPKTSADRKVPLLILFPGTGGEARPMLVALRPVADAAGFALLGISPRGENFDVVDRFFDDREAGRANARVDWPAPIFGAESADVLRTIDRLVATASIDPANVGLLGFSHGASYALALGLSQPGKFRAIIALSPGLLLLSPQAKGGQSIFLAHGRSDPVQPYARTACSMVPKLTGLGYRVRFSGFDGTHRVDDAVLREALADYLAIVAGEPGPGDPGRSTTDCAAR